MLNSKLYRTAAAIIGAGTCGIYAYKSDVRKHFSAPLRAAVPEKQDLTGSCKPWDDNWDKRKNWDKDVPRPTATRHYILVRHGQYNLKGANDAEKKLTTLGREQALLTGERLKAHGVDIDKIYESTMTRAKETSELIRKSLPDVVVQQTDLLREGAPIRPEPSHAAWDPPEHEFHADGPRIEAAFRKFFHRASPKQEKDSVEVYVCHGNVIRYIACRVLQFPPEAWLRINLRHCSITWITVRPNGRVSLRCLGDTGHLPPDKISSV